LLDLAGKACREQTLWLIAKIRKLRTKKRFMTLAPGKNLFAMTNGAAYLVGLFVGDERKNIL
jgi:hypothetical protein